MLGGPAASRVISELKRLGDTAARPRDSEGLVGTGATNAEIARALYISEGTARNQVSKILKKLGLRDRTRLAVHTAERGWVDRYRGSP